MRTCWYSIEEACSGEACARQLSALRENRPSEPSGSGLNRRLKKASGIRAPTHIRIEQKSAADADVGPVRSRHPCAQSRMIYT